MWKQVSTLSHSVHSLYCCRCHNIVYEAVLYVLICNTASLLSFFSWHLPWYEQKSRRTNSTFVPRMESCLHSYKSQLESNFWWPLSLLLILSEPHFLHFCSWVFIEKAVNRLLVRALFTLTQSRAFMEQMRLSVNRGNGFLCTVKLFIHFHSFWPSTRSCCACCLKTLIRIWKGYLNRLIHSSISACDIQNPTLSVVHWLICCSCDITLRNHKDH